MLMSRQEMLCTVHYPGPGSCQLYISSHTTASEVCLPSSYLAAEAQPFSKLPSLSQRDFSTSTSPLGRVWLPCLACNRACMCLFPPSPAAPPGGSQDSGEARPAGEPQHVCAVRAERAVGAAGGWRRSDRRHPDQVGEVKPSGAKCHRRPVKLTQAADAEKSRRNKRQNGADAASYRHLVGRSALSLLQHVSLKKTTTTCRLNLYLHLSWPNAGLPD